MRPGRGGRSFLGRLAELVGRSADAGFEEELTFHLERQVRDLMAEGMDEDAARREASRMFGDMDVIRGAVRQIEGEARMGTGRVEYGRDLVADARHALRQLRKRSLAGVAGLGVIALGVGAATTVFTYVDRAFLQPLPFPEGDRLFYVSEVDLGDITVSYPDYRDWAERGAHFEALTAFYTESRELQRDGEPSRVRTVRAAGDFMAVLGVSPTLGRGLEGQDGPDELVLGHAYWQQSFDGDPSVLGRTLRTNDETRVIVGVMPPEADLLVGVPDADLWLPLEEQPFMGRGLHFMRVVGRVAAGVSTDEAAQRTALMAQAMIDEGLTVHGASVEPVRSALVGEVRVPLLIVSGAVSLLFLITCVNLASLSLARAATRRPELAVRVAMGAGRGRVGRMLVTETLMQALIGGAVGLVAARAGLGWLASHADAPLLLEFGGIDGRVVLFGVALSLVTGLVFGLGSMSVAGGQRLAGLLRGAGGGASGDGVSARRSRRVLVGAEAAISVVLLVGTALLGRSMWRLLQEDPGFNPQGVLSVELDLSTARYPDDPSQVRFFETLTERIETLPEVVSASVGSHVPLSGSDTNGGFVIYGKTFPEGDGPRGKKRLVGPGYFDVMGIPLLAGRTLNASDRDGELQSVLVSEAFARRYWPGEDPLGRELCFCWGGDSAQVVVGIVGDIRHDGLDQVDEGTVYMSHAQNGRAELNLFVRVDGSPLSVVDDVRREVAALDPLQPLGDVTALDTVLRSSVSDRSSLLTVVGFFGLAALLLAAVGVYAVTAQSAGRRTAEMGLRMALGARATDVVRLVVGQELLAVVAGLVGGVVLSVALGRVLESVLYEVSPLDPGAYVAAAAVLLGLSVAAALIPARKAARSDPVTALKAE